MTKAKLITSDTVTNNTVSFMMKSSSNNASVKVNSSELTSTDDLVVTAVFSSNLIAGFSSNENSSYPLLDVTVYNKNGT